MNNFLSQEEQNYRQFALDLASLYEKYGLTYGEAEEYLDRAKYDLRQYQRNQKCLINCVPGK